jgi:hypothetical protein
LKAYSALRISLTLKPLPAVYFGPSVKFPAQSGRSNEADHENHPSPRFSDYWDFPAFAFSVNAL